RRPVPWIGPDVSARLRFQRRRGPAGDVPARAGHPRRTVPSGSAGQKGAPRMSPTMRRSVVLVAIVAAILIPGALSGFLQSRAADALIAGVLVLSLVLLAGFVGQTSFCQFSFAAIG